MDEGLSAYAFRGEGLSVEVDDLVTNLIGTCYGESFIDTDEHAAHIKGLHATVTFTLKVRGINIITCTYKIVSTVTVTVVTCTIRQ